MKVYISGPISGIEESVYRAAFERARLHLQHAGYEAVVPLDVVEPCLSPTWEDWMAADIKVLLKCTGIYMLMGWEKSRGARIERAIAVEMGMFIMHET